MGNRRNRVFETEREREELHRFHFSFQSQSKQCYSRLSHTPDFSGIFLGYSEYSDFNPIPHFCETQCIIVVFIVETGLPSEYYTLLLQIHTRVISLVLLNADSESE